MHKFKNLCEKISLQFVEFIFTNKNNTKKKNVVINNFNKSTSSQKARLKHRSHSETWSAEFAERIREKLVFSRSEEGTKSNLKRDRNEGLITSLTNETSSLLGNGSFVPTHLQRIDLARQCRFLDNERSMSR